MLEKLRLLLKEYLSISLGVRLAIGGVLGAIGSSTVIGFLAEYGAVNYALAYGARLPTEGVPYLRYAVTGISLTIFLIAAAVLLFFNWLLRGSIQQFLTSNFFNNGESFTDMPLKRYLIRAVLPAFAATQGLMHVVYVFAPLDRIPQWILIALPLALAAVIMTLARKPQWTKWFVVAVFSICISVFLVASFTPSLYGRALLFARQGGGLPVKLFVNCKDVAPCAPEVTGQLFLRTTDYFFLRDPLTQQLKEIPSRAVESVSYSGEERWGTK